MKARPGTRSISEITKEVDALGVKAEKRQLVAAAALLWHDHFEASHTIAQDISNVDGSLLHGILHRREPDYMNARYWFRRVPSHRSFACLAEKAETISAEFGGNWNALGFIDYVEQAMRERNAAREKTAREIQAAEIRCFLETLT